MSGDSATSYQAMTTTRVAALLTVVLAVACGKSEDGPSVVGPTDPPTTASSDATAADTIADAAQDVSSPNSNKPGDGAGDGSGDGAGDGSGDGAQLDPNFKPDSNANKGPPQNIKVLPKRWSRKRVTAYMKENVSKGLGVKCKVCHDTKDFAKDSEHKEEARKMILMMNDINKKSFGGKQTLSCFTCHRGKEEPEGTTQW